MEERVTFLTREQYIEMLIDDSLRDASEMESGFLSWCEYRVPIWRTQGYDEQWIRQRIETGQNTRGFLRKLKEQGLTMLEIRDALRKTYQECPELYDLVMERHPGFLHYRGNTSDLRQRYTLRILLYEADKLAFETFCRKGELLVPRPEALFIEQPDQVRVIRDLSTVEELELMLAMSRYALHLFAASELLTQDEISARMEAHGQYLRVTFFSTYGYYPEDSATPYIPVTIDGPQEHDAYYAREYSEGP